MTLVYKRRVPARIEQETKLVGTIYKPQTIRQLQLLALNFLVSPDDKIQNGTNNIKEENDKNPYQLHVTFKLTSYNVNKS